MTFGTRMKDARKNKNLTQRELGEMIGGVATSTINGYENDKTLPDAKKMYFIMQILEVSADYLFQDETINKPTDLVFLPHEEMIIRQYRQLDQYGKNIIASVLNIENSRIYDDEQTYEAKSILHDEKMESISLAKPENPDKEHNDSIRLMQNTLLDVLLGKIEASEAHIADIKKFLADYDKIEN